MSHFNCFVITPDRPDAADLEKIMMPFHEYECTGLDNEYVYDVDVTDKVKADFQKYKQEGEVFDDKWVKEWNGAKPGKGTKKGRYYKYTNPNAKWDWYQVGGRWTGALAQGYEPGKDPRNIETCSLCSGTGKRDDALGRAAREKDPSYDCNGCQGTGKRVKWPTQWAKFDGDQRQLSELDLDKLEPSFALIKDGQWIERGQMGWWATVKDEKGKEDWTAQFKALLADLPPTTWLTVVDCHI